MLISFLIVTDIILLVLYALYIQKPIYIIHNHEYNGQKYFEYLKNNIIKIFLYPIIQFVIMTIGYILIKQNLNNDNYIIVLDYTIIYILINVLQMYVITKKEKIKEYTPKIKIIYSSNIILVQIIVAVAIFITKTKSILDITYFYSLMLVFSPILILIGYFMVKPKQNSLDKASKKYARNKINSMPNLIKILIVSNDDQVIDVKRVLNTILSEKYNILCMDGKSTKMQNIETIEKHLKKEYQVLILDINTDKIEEINELCDISNPNYILVLPEENKDNINAKKELLNNYSDIATFIISSDNEKYYDMYLNKPNNIILYGIEFKRDLYMKADEIEVLEFETKFKLEYKNQKEECSTRLLGHVNVSNLLACASISHKLGLTLKQIKDGISKV